MNSDAKTNRITKQKDNYPMNILLDINHPSHFHFFRKFILEIREKGYNVIITAAEKDCLHELFKAWNIPFINKGKRSGNLFGKALKLLRETWMIYRIARKNNIDLFLSFASPYAAIAGKLAGKPVITFDDTENDFLLHLFFPTFSEFIITPECYEKDFGRKHYRFRGYKESTYLREFLDKEMDNDKQADTKKSPVVLIRFVRHSATHELGEKGYTIQEKVTIVSEISPFAEVYISSEEKLPGELKDYQINIPPEKMHQFLKTIDLYFGESTTMAAESAVLGIPSILTEDKGRGYIRDLQSRFGIIQTFKRKNYKAAIKEAIDYLQNFPSSRPDKKEIYSAILKESIDITPFLVNIVENFPSSLHELKKDIPRRIQK